MATESPMRMMESGGGRNWPSSKAAGAYVPPLSNMAAEELGMILKGHRRQGDQRNMVPNRSGSAPPSMEGSLEAFGNLMAQQSSILNSTLPGFSSQTQAYESEEKLRADPAYLAYYYSNVNLNPRLPPPMISRENQRLASHVAGLGGNRRLPSLDDSEKGSVHFTRGSLSTHKEEPEDERSPRQSSDDCSESSNPYMLEHNAASLATRHKSLVDLIQADFPRTPSPLYSHSHSLSHATTEESIDHDVHAISVKNLSLDVSKSAESQLDSVDAGGDRVPSNDNSSVTTKGKKARSPNSQSSGVDGSSRDKVLAGGVSRSEAFSVQEHKSHNLQRGATYQVQGPPVSSQGANLPRAGTEKVTHGYSKVSTDLLTVPRPPGLASPAYASPTPYITPGHQFLPGLHPSGVYTPQYSVGGYALSSAFLPPFIAGYPSPTGMPMQYDAISGQSFSGRTPGVSTGEGIPHAGDLQHMQKFYGQQGLLLQPSFMDPIQMQYLQHSAEDVYGAPGQYGWVTSMGSLGSQVNSYPSPKEAVDAVYRADKKFVPSPNGSASTPSPRIAGIAGSSYYGSPQNMGVMTQFPVSPLGSPLLPGSPVGGVNHAGWRSEFRFSPGSSRSTGAYSPWHGHRGNENSGEPRRQSFLEELKSSHAHRIDLSDIAGHIIELSVDQHGSRFIQQKLENCGVEEKASVFQEVLPNALKLMTDVFGNYVIQKFFEHGTREQRKELAGQLSGQMLPLSLQMYGCRVIQKALEVIELDQKAQLVHELDGHVMRCVRDQNGNHVIQKCIECVSPENIGFILKAFEGQVATLSTHPYGCRVIQRVLEHCSDDSQSQSIVNEILESSYILAQDQYGNYVTQHVLERGKPQERSRIISKLTGKIVQLSQHKYASNVVEKCLEYGDAAEREALIEEVVGPSEENDNLLAMMKDQFANYVVQKILEKSDNKQREALLRRIRIHLNALKKYTYGKHIVARFEQLFGEDNEVIDTTTN